MDIELVVKIPERIHYGIEKGITVNGSKASQILIDAAKNGTPLPKGHGRLIDENDLSLMTVHLIDGVFVCDAPTIIEKDKEQEDEANN